MPLRPVMEPFVWRLSPRQPGYVMTVCEETRADRKERRVIAADSDCMAPSMVSVIGVQTESWAVAALGSNEPTRCSRN